jgi:hypothetical protein
MAIGRRDKGESGSKRSYENSFFCYLNKLEKGIVVEI